MDPTASTTGNRRRFRFVSALRHRDFRIFYMGILTGDFGIEMQVVARGWLIYDITGSVFWLGIVTSALGFSSFAAAPVGGLLADRMNKRTLMIAGRCAIAVDMALMGIGIWAGFISPWLLIGGTAILGLSLGFSSPSRFAAVSQLVEPETLLNAVSLSSSTRNITRIAAPVLAGYMIRVWGADAAYFAIAMLYLSSALVLLGLPKLPPPDRAAAPVRSSIWSDAGEGFRSIKSSTTLSLLIAAAILSNGFGAPVNFLLPFFAEDVLDVGPEGLGFLTASAGVGSILGLAFLASLGDYQHKGALLLAAIIGLGVGVVLFGFSTTYWLSLALLVPMGLAQTAQMVLNNTLLLANAPEQVRGRVMSVFQMTGSTLSFTIVPMGALTLLVGASVIVQFVGGALLTGGVLLTAATPVLRRLR